MPRITELAPWVKPFRRQIRITCGPGWTARNKRGRLILVVTDEGDVTLPFEWSEAGAALALPRIQQIYKQHASGELSLKAAASDVDTSSDKQRLDMAELIREYRLTKTTVSESTWAAKHAKVLANAQREMSGAADGTELVQRCIAQWKPGSRQRQIMRQSLSAFLKWAVERRRLKACFLPPLTVDEARNAKRDGYALSDTQILRLLESLPEGAEHERWRFALQLIATYGLRPEELRHLVVKDGAHGPELWCLYRKSQGGRKGAKTEPRRLHGLAVKDLDGTPQQWNLAARVAVREELPPLGQPGKGGEALGTYLRRRTVWDQLKREAEAVGEQLTPYSFRHRYSKQSHAARIPIANIAAAMGHTVEVHLSSYSRFTPDSTADLYAGASAPAVLAGV